MNALLRRIVASFRRRRLDRDFDDEVAFHLAMREAAGISRSQAQRRFGNVTALKETMREAWTFPSIDSVRQDAGYALRNFRRQPGFTATVVVVLAAAIGLNTSLSTLAAGLILRPWAAVSDPARVVAIYLPHATGPAAGRFGISATDYRLLAGTATSFEGLTAMAPYGARFNQDGGAGKVLLVSGNFFGLLGVSMARGRGFRQDEDRAGRPEAVTVLSYGYWQGRFGGDPGIVGKRVRLNDADFTVVGVAPRDLGFSEYMVQVRALVPTAAIGLLETHARAADDFLYRSTFCCSDLVGRLKPGVSREQARAELELLSATFESQDGKPARGTLVTGTEFTAHPGRGAIRAAAGMCSRWR